MHTSKLQAQRSTLSFVAPEFGIEHEGCVALIWRALHGGKVAGHDFWHHLQDCMGQLGFSSSHNGLGCQNDQQGRNTTNAICCMLMMFS
jgi:hypothetical protein